jgi:hypothetical protein
MSNDARDGMELMHQMTCAASSGNFDPVAFLADLSSVQKAGTSEQTNPPPKSSQIVKISASKIIPFPVVPSTSQQTSVPSGKTYPQLDKFIGNYNHKLIIIPFHTKYL